MQDGGECEGTCMRSSGILRKPDSQVAADALAILNGAQAQSQFAFHIKTQTSESHLILVDWLPNNDFLNV